MEPKGYELLKIETKIQTLEKELSALFSDFKKYEVKQDELIENTRYEKLQKMNVCCLELLQAYREYTNNLKNLPVVIPHVYEIVNHFYHKYVIRLENKETRDTLQKRLNANVHYPNPISENPMYKSILNRKDNCLNSQLICDTILTLPIHPYLTNDEVDKVCTSIMMTI